jgi:hypothetical protein
MTIKALFSLFGGLVFLTSLHSQIVINEVDSDTPGTDLLEFVELYGPANASLNGYVVVFFNGLNDLSYGSFDLDGYSLDANGFFVLGNSAVDNVDLTFANNLLQSGSDAIALYSGNASNWPAGTAISLVSLIDAVVYDTDDADDFTLLALTPGQPQVNESANGFPVDQSIARVPNGGAALETTTYLAQQPTPGASNELDCIGGTVATTEGATVLNLCTDDNSDLIFLVAENVVGTGYYWIFTQTDNTIISYSDINSFDPDLLLPGTCRLYGLSYAGIPSATTLQVGDHIDNVVASICAVPSYNFITINKELCNDPECDAGEITDALGGNYVVACLDGTSDLISFQTNSEPTADSYTWIITDISGFIIETTTLDFVDFNAMPEGSYRVYGVSHEGPLDASTIEVDENIDDVEGTGYCIDISSNFVTVIAQPCEVSPGCADLFFSEYVEGASNNKAVEIFNPTDQDISLTGYTVHTYNNGSSVPTNSFNLTGTIAAGDAYVIANSQADFLILDEADYTSSITWFNGNDALVLYFGGQAIDAIGIPGVDPITAWTVGNGTTGEQTLVRKVNVTAGTTDWVLGASQWNVYPQNTFTFLGSHSFLGCEFLNAPQISINTSSQSVEENATYANVIVEVYNPIYAVEVTLSLTGGTATPGADFTNTLPITLIFPEGSTAPQTVQIPLIDDEEIESDETIDVLLTAGTGVVLLQQTQQITIEDNDALVPSYDIIEITGVDDESMADSLGVECQLQGIVHGVNTFPGGIQFTLIDDTDGIGVFNGDSDLGYVVQEGDEVIIVGVIDQFNGLTQITPSSIEFISSANTINTPEIVSELSELTESAIVELKCIELVNPSQWTNTLPGFNVEVTDGNNTWEVRIDGDTEIFGSDAPLGHFSVSGIGGQFDPVEPYDTGYQLLPRYFDDFSPSVYSSFDDISTIVFGTGENITINFVNQSEGGTFFLWNFGDGATSTVENPSHEYDFDFLVANDEITITLLITGFLGCTDIYTFTVETSYLNLEENTTPNLEIFPNPAEDKLQFGSSCSIESYVLTDAQGRTVYSSNNVNLKKGEVDVSVLTSGVYTIRFETACGTTIQKFIKL